MKLIMREWMLSTRMLYMFKSAVTSDRLRVESPEMTLLATAKGGGRGGLEGDGDAFPSSWDKQLRGWDYRTHWFRSRSYLEELTCTGSMPSILLDDCLIDV
jgi:hypothetical protein